MKKYAKRLLAVMLALTMLAAVTETTGVSAKTVKKTIAVGKTYSVKMSGCTYQSGNNKIAYVNEEGLITAKKKGTVSIKIKKGNTVKKKISLKVKENKKVPAMGACGDEIQIGEVVVSSGQNKIELSQLVKNNGTSVLRKIRATYSITGNKPEEETPSGASGSSVAPAATVPYETEVQVKETGIRAGKEVTINLQKEFGEGTTIENVALKKLEVYSLKAVAVWDGSRESWSYGWGVRDTKAPVIKGLVGKKAYNSHYKDAVRTVYKGKRAWLLKHVSATDNRDGKVKVSVDTSAINWNKKGIYTVVYKAKDSAGNEAKVKTKVQVRVAGNDLDRYASSVLRKIVRESWTDEKKARAIYKYVRGKMAYIDSNDHSSWERSSLHALRYHSGNCFGYYSLSRLLLTRCGIPNQTVTRYRGRGHHWWNFVYIKGGWYHFDTTPRRMNGYFCLWTDAQLTSYSNRAGHSHIWNRKWVPKSGKKL